MPNGKKILIFMVVTFFVLAILATVLLQILYRSVGGTTNADKQLFQFLIRTIFEILLFVSLLKGRAWARIVLTILLMLSGIFGIITSAIAISDLPQSTQITLLHLYFYTSLTRSIIYILFAVLLQFIPSVKEFFKENEWW